MWVWLDLVWARYFAPSLSPAAAAAAPGEALGSRAGATPRAGGVPGAAAWSVGAVARPAGAAVSALCASRGPFWGRSARFCGLGSGGGLPGRRRLPDRRRGVGGGHPWLPCRLPDRHRCLRQPTFLALRENLPRISRGDGGAGPEPAVVAVVLLGGAIGVGQHCYPGQHAWRQACPLHYLLVHQWCAGGSAVQCCAGRRGRGEGEPAVVLAPCGRGPLVIHRHWGGVGGPGGGLTKSPGGVPCRQPRRSPPGTTAGGAR